jgi:hypothetical protein
MPATATSLTVLISGVTATDDVGVSGYLITESATAPVATAAGWFSAAPTSYTFTAGGNVTAYAWAKDAAGNVSSSKSAPVSITLTDTAPPKVTSFTLPATATSMAVTVTSLTATDDVGVVGYLITESATAPAANAGGWSATAPTSFTFSAAGSVTAYAWVKDAVGSISTSLSSSVIIALPLSQPTLSDALKVLQHLDGKIVLSDVDKIRYDVAPLGSNDLPLGDGKIDIADVIVILRRSAGIGSW